MAMTMSGTTLTFNDSTTQTTAAGSTTFGAIGTVASVGNFSASILKPNDTIAGSSLAYVSGTVLGAGTNNQTLYISGYNYTNPGKWEVGTANKYYWLREGTTFNGTQFSDVVGSGASTLSGTWRVIGQPVVAKRYEAAFDGYAYTSYLQHIGSVLAIRIS